VVKPDGMTDEFSREPVAVMGIGIGLTAAEVNPLASTYGYDRLRFPKPVSIGDTLHTELTIAAAEPDPKRPGHGRVVNQRGETVLAVEHILLVARRPDAIMG